MAYLKLSSLTLLMLFALAGCLSKGQPLIADRSPQPPADNPSRTAQPDTVRVVRHEPTRVQTPPVREARPIRPPKQYIVRPGDTLYSIAWRFNLDPRQVARLNSIPAPHTIFPGQLLRLTGNPVAQASKPAARAKVEKQPTTSKAKPAPKPRAVKPIPATNKWHWPVPDRPSQEFSRSSKGMDYLLAQDRAISAAGAGEVVYAGNGIGGYERLIIVRHAGNLLSAYSFSGKLAVSEGQSVKAGQKVADIIKVGRSSQKLHFELRAGGKPINPRSVIK